MKCKKAENLIPFLISGELKGLGKIRLKKHISSCPHCSGIYERELKLQEVILDLSGKPVEKLSPGFRESFLRKWEMEKARERTSFHPRLAVAGAIVAIALIAGSGALLYINSHLKVNEKELYLNMDLYENLDVILAMEEAGG